MNLILISGLILLLLAFLIPALWMLVERMKTGYKGNYLFGLPFFLITCFVIWLEILIFYGLDKLADGLYDWKEVPYALSWWLGFFFGFVELAILVLAIGFISLGAIYE